MGGGVLNTPSLGSVHFIAFFVGPYRQDGYPSEFRFLVNYQPQLQLQLNLRWMIRGLYSYLTTYDKLLLLLGSHPPSSRAKQKLKLMN